MRIVGQTRADRRAKDAVVVGTSLAILAQGGFFLATANGFAVETKVIDAVDDVVPSWALACVSLAVSILCAAGVRDHSTARLGLSAAFGYWVGLFCAYVAATVARGVPDAHDQLARIALLALFTGVFLHLLEGDRCFQQRPRRPASSPQE